MNYPCFSQNHVLLFFFLTFFFCICQFLPINFMFLSHLLIFLYHVLKGFFLHNIFMNYFYLIFIPHRLALLSYGFFSIKLLLINNPFFFLLIHFTCISCTLDDFRVNTGSRTAKCMSVSMGFFFAFLWQ